MAITPQDIEQLTFSPSKHGYSTEEVDTFLDQIAGEVDAMLKKIADLKARLNNSEQQLASSQAQVRVSWRSMRCFLMILAHNLAMVRLPPGGIAAPSLSLL